MICAPKVKATKRRVPFSSEDAILHCVSVLGWEVATQVTGKSAAQLRRFMDPDQDEHPQLRLVEALDIAMAEHNHDPVNRLAWAARHEATAGGERPHALASHLESASHTIRRASEVEPANGEERTHALRVIAEMQAQLAALASDLLGEES